MVMLNWQFNSAKRHHQSKKPHKHAVFSISQVVLVWISVWIMLTMAPFTATCQISTRGEMTYIVILIWNNTDIKDWRHVWKPKMPMLKLLIIPSVTSARNSLIPITHAIPKAENRYLTVYTGSICSHSFQTNHSADIQDMISTIWLLRCITTEDPTTPSTRPYLWSTVRCDMHCSAVIFPSIHLSILPNCITFGNYPFCHFSSSGANCPIKNAAVGIAAHLHDVRNLDVCVCFYTPYKREFIWEYNLWIRVRNSTSQLRYEMWTPFHNVSHRKALRPCCE